ncbi:MAG: hypothetical protein O2816_07160, partial [Planctomycetota bacterium]|nr:hypothetical protein [Planctomycetota bacterium]
MKSHLSLLLAALGSFSVRPAVQDASPAQPDGVPSVPDVLAEWRAEHGRAWQTEVDHRTGHVDFLFGGTAHGELSPVTDEEWLAAGRAFVEESIDLHGIEVDTLVDERVLYLPLGMVGSSDKWTARYQQRVNQVPVVDGTVNVLFDAFGGLLSIQSNAEPWVSGLDTVPSIGAGQAAASAGQHFTERFGVQARPGSLPAPVILRASDGEAIVAQLAWQLDLAATLPDGTPEAWRYWVSAEDGSVLRADTHKHNLDVEGTVQSLVTPGTSPDTPGNAEVLEPMPYIRVTSSAGTVNADENGYFVFPGVNSPLSVTVQYTGTFANVDHATGSNYSLTVQVPANSPSSVVTMNPSPTEVITAQANAYLNVTLLRDWIRGINPSDSTADFQAQANANLSNTCNAFFNGNSTNYYQSGGGCVNTAYSTVVAHEMGHWLNVLYGTGNGSDGIGEGNADVFATYMFDDPIVGKDFSGSGNHIRDGNNNNQFCGDCCGGCYGGVHADGTVWMGAAWKVRTNLKNSLGAVLGGQTANGLFMGWMNGFNQTAIDSIIEIQWL